MKRTAIIVGLLMVLGSIPAATTAKHLSVGGFDAVGTDGQQFETDPSVSQEAYDRGTTPLAECYQADADVTAEEVQAAADADGFCNDLVYHPNGGDLTQVSPPDQHVPSDSPVGEFNVITTRYVSNFLVSSGICEPFCRDDPGGDVAWNAVHSVGSSVGHTENAGDADDGEGDGRGQVYSAKIYYPSAAKLTQENTGLWEMNGWMNPGATRSYVGFLQDSQGNPITQADLDSLVSTMTDNGDLDTSTLASVCGWTPDGDYTSTGTATGCEVDFTYRGPGEHSPGETSDEYSDECNSPTYICGGSAGPAWYSDLNCAGLCAGLANTDYWRWHWFVAPHPADCNGAQAPGASFDGDGASLPYLAHDLDVYTTVTGVNGVEQGQATPAVQDYGVEVTNNALGILADEAGGILDQVPGTPEEVEDTVDSADQASNAVIPGHRVEPNAKPAGDLQDTSQSLGEGDSQLERSVAGDDPCAQIDPTQETQQTVDPWVNIVDNEAFYSAGAAGLAAGTFGTTDEDMDQHNNPTPGTYFISGKVGMFTDKDDDGFYDQVGGLGSTGEKYTGTDINEVGAYPMLYDMWLNDDGTVDGDAGCTVSGKNLVKIMKQGGYGTNTGLATAVYLQEPTVFRAPGSGGPTSPGDDVAPFPLGNNIYLFLTDGAKEKYVPESGHTGDLSPTQVNPTSADISNGNDLDDKIDDLVSDLRQYADDKNGDLPAPPVRLPGNEFGFQSDFDDQCDGATGRFDVNLEVLHQCQTGCEGDTIATMYTFDADTVGGTLVPEFTGSGAGAYSFGAGQHAWYDVDPFDGDPQRQNEESHAPPTG